MQNRINPAQTEMFTPLEVFGAVGVVEETLRGFLYGRTDGAYRLSLSTTINALWTRWDEYSARADEWKACIQGCFLAPANLMAAQARSPLERQSAKQRLAELQTLADRAPLMLEKDFEAAIRTVRNTVLEQWRKDQAQPKIVEKAITSFTEWMTDEFVRQNQHATTLRDLARGALARHTPPEKPKDKTAAEAKKKTVKRTKH